MGRDSRFKLLADVFAALEQTPSSLKMIDILADFFPRVSPEEARIAAYLLRGEVAPSYAGMEFGLAEKLVIKAIAESVGESGNRVTKLFKKTGDLGDVAGSLISAGRGRGLKIAEVFTRLRDIARSSGPGSQEKKIGILAKLLQDSTPREARYIVRLVLSNLRLGVAEMTFLYGLSKALTGVKDQKKVLEEAFNVLSDLGEVAYRARKKGVQSLTEATPTVGVPVRMMLASRVANLEEVKKHVPGEVFVEYKYDGERIQAHIKKGEVVLFSRRQENITHQFPDVIESVKEVFRGKEAIVEGEAVAVDVKTDRLRPFQILMTRRRKHEIEKYVERVPVKYFLFDILFLDGQSFLKKKFRDRKEALKQVFAESRRLALAKCLLTDELEEIEGFFLEATKAGGEGVMIKDASGIYEAGTRGWKWIKFKKDYQAEPADTFDLVVVGGLYGAGRRGGTYGSLLGAAFDPRTNKYYSFSKVGAGFTDEDLSQFRGRLDKYKLKEKSRLVETGMKSDVWFEPKLVMEVAGAEITLSPVHPAARERIKKAGLALRFPRFLRWREDKTPEQATTVEEIYALYKR